MKVLNDSLLVVGNGMKSILMRVLIQKWVSLFLEDTILCRQDLYKILSILFTELNWAEKTEVLLSENLFFVESHL